MWVIVSAASHEFFLVALPGLEELAKSELNDWFPQLSAQVVHGGVVVHAPWAVGLSMNRALKIPTRILLRVDRFSCRDFPKLFQRVSKLPWEKWIDEDWELEVHASSTGSRLKIKKRIEETCLKARRARQKVKKEKKNSLPPRLSLYVRLEDNECTVSLDTSGERLHKRGLGKHIGQAPLRETIAAAVIQWMGRVIPPSENRVEVVDPMMGSGTFLTEVALRDQVLERELPLKSGESLELAPPLVSSHRRTVDALMGFEMDAKTFKAAQTNLQNQTRGFELKLFKQDVFDSEFQPHSPKLERWVVCNPPYGVRLKVEEPLKEFYERIFSQVEKNLKPHHACFLIPNRGVKGRFVLPFGWKVKGKQSFSNGGIFVTAFLFSSM